MLEKSSPAKKPKASGKKVAPTKSSSDEGAPQGPADRKKETMNKLEIIEALRNETDLTKSEAQQVVQTFFDEISDALVQGERVELRGLCAFFVKQYKSNTGRNPKTAEEVVVPAKRLPFFKPGLELKERVNALF